MSSKQQVRIRIAQEAARLIIEEGMDDFFKAKQKALIRLRLDAKVDLPRNRDIEAALNEYHQLYHSSTQHQRLTHLRKLACEGMQLLQDFSPRLVGSVLEGYAGQHSTIILHVFTDTAEAVLIKLLDNGIPFTETSHTVIRTRKDGKELTETLPACQFLVDDTPVELKIFPISGPRHRPGVATASLEQLRTLLKNSSTAPQKAV